MYLKLIWENRITMLIRLGVGKIEFIPRTPPARAETANTWLRSSLGGQRKAWIELLESMQLSSKSVLGETMCSENPFLPPNSANKGILSAGRISTKHLKHLLKQSRTTLKCPNYYSQHKIMSQLVHLPNARRRVAALVPTLRRGSENALVTQAKLNLQSL